MFERIEDWQQALVEEISNSAHMPYKPGTMDCAIFAARAITAITGRDLQKEYPAYSSYKDGIKALKKRGFTNLQALAAVHFPQISAQDARAGDIAFIGKIPAIVQGEFIYVRTKEGLGLCPLSDGDSFWRVG